MRYLLILFLFLAGCTTPLRVQIETREQENTSYNTLITAMSLEILGGGFPSKKILANLAKGYTHETLDDFGEYLKEAINVRDDIIDNWIRRVKRRYERMTGESIEEKIP